MTRALARRGVAGWRAAALAGTLLALLAGYLTATVISASAADPLLSQGRPATASSTESAGTPASAAVDGNPGTRWSSAFSDPQWIQVDLGSTATISRVVLTWEGAYARAFTIQTSADGTTWTTVHTTTAGTGGTQDLAVTGTGRYVRLHATARATGWGVSLWEFQVYGTTGTRRVRHRQRRAGQARHRVLRRVTPGSRPPRRSTATPAPAGPAPSADPQWFQVDLGAPQRDQRRRPELGGRLRDGVHRSSSRTDGTTWTTRPHHDRRDRRHADARRSPAPAGTSGSTGTQRAPRRTATRCGSSRSSRAARHRSPPTSPSTSPPTSPSPGGPTCCSPTTSRRSRRPARTTAPATACTPDKAFDNDPASRWATSATTGWVDPGWIYVDLGATAHDQPGRAAVGPGVRDGVPDPGLRRRQHLDDRSTRPPPVDGFKETINATGTGRYVRMYGTARGQRRTATRCGSSRSTAPAAAPTAPPAMPPDPTFPATRLVFERRVQRRRRQQARPGEVDDRPGHRPEQRDPVLHEQRQRAAWTAPARWSSRPAGRPPAAASTPRTG